DTSEHGKIEEAYTTPNANEEYRQFKSMTPIIGTWDDHDLAFDTAIGTFSGKLLSKNHFLNFIEQPKSTMRRQQEGIYTSYTFGESTRKIKIILLDNRYFKGLEKSAPMLGETQWKWLENELSNSDASLHFIVSGLSILSRKIPVTEEWA